MAEYVCVFPLVSGFFPCAPVCAPAFVCLPVSPFSTPYFFAFSFLSMVPNFSYIGPLLGPYLFLLLVHYFTCSALCSLPILCPLAGVLLAVGMGIWPAPFPSVTHLVLL